MEDGDDLEYTKSVTLVFILFLVGSITALWLAQTKTEKRFSELCDKETGQVITGSHEDHQVCIPKALLINIKP